MGFIDDLVNAARGNSSGLTGANIPPTPTDMSNGTPPFAAPPPTPDTQTPDIQRPSSPQPPNQQQQRIQGVKGYLANILHGVGEGMKAHLGMETDAQQQQRLYTQSLQNQKFALDQQNIQSGIMQRAAVVKQMQSAVTLPNGMQVPFALAKPYIDAWGKQQAAATGKRFMIVPNVGMLDTQADGGPKLVPGSSPQGVQVTPEIAQQYNIPLQMIGKSIPLGQFAQLERGGAAWAGNVSNTVETKEVSDPNNPGSTMLVQVPKTTTSQRVAPASSVVPTSTPQAPGQQPVQATPQGSRPPVSMTNRNGIRILTGPNGQPLQGKSGGDTVYATDPKTGQQIYTTRSEAAAQGLQTPLKVTAPEVRKDQALSNRLADVQRKVGDYAATFDQPIDSQDQMAISYILDNNIGAGIHGFNLLPQYIQSQLKARGMQALSENGMRRLIQYNQARESLSGYQQILTNSSRSSDKILELQLEQLPPPIADSQYANMTTGEFQKNIDLAGQHIPIFPGSAETQQGIKASQMASRTQNAAIQNNFNRGANAQKTPPRPANVPQDYIYKVNGPKGTGWYRP